MINKTKNKSQLKKKSHMQLRLKTHLTKIVNQYLKNKNKNKAKAKAKKVINKMFLTLVKQKCNFLRKELVKF